MNSTSTSRDINIFSIFPRHVRSLFLAWSFSCAILITHGSVLNGGIPQAQIIDFKIDFESIFKFDFLLPPWPDFGHTADEQLQLPGMTACANTATHCDNVTVALRIRMGSQFSVQEKSLL